LPFLILDHAEDSVAKTIQKRHGSEIMLVVVVAKKSARGETEELMLTNQGNVRLGKVLRCGIRPKTVVTMEGSH